MKLKPSPALYNLTTLAGISMAALSLVMFLFLGAWELLAAHPNPYIGTIAFIVLPAVLAIGVLVAIVGYLRERYLERRGKGEIGSPMDFADPKSRRRVVAFSAGMLLILVTSSFGSYQLFRYTETEEFCGDTCHPVMRPEQVTYGHSPHARVSCVECHIGSGATWFVRSKLSGLSQVYATLTDRFPRPIPTPIENLRPAQETCEECHWSRMAHTEKLHTQEYFRADERNTRWSLSLLMKIGGGEPESGRPGGIHWHMNLGNDVTYAHLDDDRQIIVWVRSRLADGREVVYRNTDISPSDPRVPSARIRKMDCMDCHNRPAHTYPVPSRLVNRALSLGRIRTDLPAAKRVAMEVLDRQYLSEEEARREIASSIRAFYRKGHPQVARENAAAIDSMVTAVQAMYVRAYFPEMKTDWRGFIDNVGHLYYPGCFRCHGGKHSTDGGAILSRDCNECHVILEQDSQKDRYLISHSETGYLHPGDNGDAWKETLCSRCHGAS